MILSTTKELVSELLQANFNETVAQILYLEHQQSLHPSLRVCDWDESDIEQTLESLRMVKLKYSLAITDISVQQTVNPQKHEQDSNVS